MRATFESVRFITDGPFGNVDFDSADPPDPVPLTARAPAALVGLSLTMRMRYDLSGGQDGTLEIDESTGWLLSSRLEGTFAGTMTMEGMPGMPEGMSTPLSVRSVVTIESIEGHPRTP